MKIDSYADALVELGEQAQSNHKLNADQTVASPRWPSGSIVTDMDQVHEAALRAKLIEMGWRPPGEDSAHKLNADRTVAVATDVFWNEDMTSCPRGTKCQLLGEGGVATYGVYNGDPFWVGWAPVPKRRRK